MRDPFTVNTSCQCPQQTEYYPVYLILIFPISAAFGNLAFCLSVICTPKLRTVPNFFLVSDAVADLIVSGCMIPLRIMFYVQDDCFPAGHALCQLFIASTEYVSAASLSHAAVISIERHVRLFNPSAYKKYSKAVFIPVLILIWFYPAIFTYIKTFVPSALNLYPYDDTDDGDICRQLQRTPCNCLLCFPTYINLIDITGQNILPLSITFAMYGHIMYVAHRRIRLAERIRRSLTSTTSTRNSSDTTPTVPPDQPIPPHPSYARKMLQSPEFRSIRLFLVILIVLCICVIPSISNHIALLFYADDSIRQLQTIIEAGGHVLTSNCNVAYESLRFAIPVLLWSNSLINPLLLFILNRNYRVAFRAVMTRVRRKARCLIRKGPEVGSGPARSRGVQIPSGNRWYRVTIMGDYSLPN
ncbi:beta-3 adrenergic receptor-like [Paramacrobiotus metropolitanus]|uniref:beta-3 adrenergic receptor-like n=1 Tax=Paramacrobiotus metropolitanus TaxID=2943436 RepID=UPI002445B258|nr:beta-3 adrenergic receptor-like [Paramacrobiotus metropolitanus]XP_055337842.1 beta-3 adrenergic receptor-like [Paramacrobiotus metropolitanus]XP_055337843.1 beta-3 adrenergic receptor-like [Paramacrobiotus metropolitanus]